MENIILLAVPVHKARCAGSRGSGSDGRTGSKMTQPSNSQQAQGTGVQTPPTTPTTSKPSAQPTLGAKFISAGLAACWADCVTFPLDLAKVKLQVQGEAVGALTASAASSQASGTAAAVAAQQFKYRGVFGTLHTVCKEEGFRAMYNGLVPGLQRQMCFASVRIGLYDSVKQMYVDFFKANGLVSGQNIGLRILAGVTTGGMAVVCAQPTDVVKVRMQAHKAGTPKLYSGSIDAYRKIAKHEGVKGLWRGALPNITRNAIVNTAELVSYDLIKEFILRHGWLSDNLPCHFVSAFGAGFCTTVVASPVDVVKTRYMNDGKGVYRGAFHCATTMFREGGFMTFYKGFMPSFLRLGSWNIVMFVSFEQLKRFVCKYQNQSSELPASQTFPQVKLNTDSNKQVV